MGSWFNGVKDRLQDLPHFPHTPQYHGSNKLIFAIGPLIAVFSLLCTITLVPYLLSNRCGQPWTGWSRTGNANYQLVVADTD